MTTEQAENRRIWVEALRSGKYRQTETKLNRITDNGTHPVGMCCLGVACDVIGPLLGLEWEDHGWGFLSMGQRTDALPEAIAVALNVTVYGKLANPLPEGHSLYKLNDSAGYTFSQIADVIESGNLKPWEGE